jgi:tetratricopeptide (TPR) repeat protein
VRAFTWSLPGAGLGLLATFGAVQLKGWGVGAALLVGLAIWAGTFAAPLIISSLSGRAAGTLYNPSGASTPRRREYSHAESLVARGLYDQAIAAFEVAVAEDPTDATPYLRIARVLRDHLGAYEDAAGWFKRALAQPTMLGGLRAATSRELIELYANRLGSPGRAAPLLARLAEERAGTPEGEWAAAELTRVKTKLTDGR